MERRTGNAPVPSPWQGEMLLPHPHRSTSFASASYQRNEAAQGLGAYILSAPLAPFSREVRFGGATWI